MSNLTEIKTGVWIFKIDGSPLHSTHKAKSEVYKKEDVKYNFLTARRFNQWGSKYVVVLHTKRAEMKEIPE